MVSNITYQIGTLNSSSRIELKTGKIVVNKKSKKSRTPNLKRSILIDTRTKKALDFIYDKYRNILAKYLRHEMKIFCRHPREQHRRSRVKLHPRYEPQRLRRLEAVHLQHHRIVNHRRPSKHFLSL